jgi:DNA-binding beta-propeller fold protein YncE
MPNLAYVVDNGSNIVSVIDTNPASPSFNMEIDLIPLSGTNPILIAITPDSIRAYVTNQNSNNVSVIDTNPASPTFNRGRSYTTFGDKSRWC